MNGAFAVLTAISHSENFETSSFTYPDAGRKRSLTENEFRMHLSMNFNGCMFICMMYEDVATDQSSQHEIRRGSWQSFCSVSPMRISAFVFSCHFHLSPSYRLWIPDLLLLALSCSFSKMRNDWAWKMRHGAGVGWKQNTRGSPSSSPLVIKVVQEVVSSCKN